MEISIFAFALAALELALVILALLLLLFQIGSATGELIVLKLLLFLLNILAAKSFLVHGNELVRRVLLVQEAQTQLRLLVLYVEEELLGFLSVCFLVPADLLH